MSTPQDSPASNEAFEAWWDEHGQFCRAAGGGQHEKTFAFNAWRAATTQASPEAVDDAALWDHARWKGNVLALMDFWQGCRFGTPSESEARKRIVAALDNARMYWRAHEHLANERRPHQFAYGGSGYQCRACGAIWAESNGINTNGPCLAGNERRETAEPSPAAPVAETADERTIRELIEQRDHRDAVIDDLCDAVLGNERPEWSSAYDFANAVNDVMERMAWIAPGAPAPAAGAAQAVALEQCKAGGPCRWRGNASAAFVAEHRSAAEPEQSRETAEPAARRVMASPLLQGTTVSALPATPPKEAP